MHSLARCSLALTVLLAPTAAIASGRAEIGLAADLGGGSSRSPVLYSPHPGERIAGDPGPIYGGGAAPYRPSIGGELSVGYGAESVSIGFFGTFHSRRTSAPAGVRDLTRTTILVGPYVRVSAPIAPLRPWASLGVAYANDDQSWSTSSTIPGLEEQWSLEHRGVALRLALGLEYRVARVLGIGPQLAITRVIPVSGCARVSAADPRVVGTALCTDDSTSGQVTSAEGYTQWSLGLALRLNVP